jgi:hypothetical protein
MVKIYDNASERERRRELVQRALDGEVILLESDIQGTVTCIKPCVPECTREHPWEKK